MTVGKYGLDFLLLARAGKGIKTFHEIRRANAIMTLESMTKLHKAKTLEEIAGKWNNNVTKELENIKSGALKKDKELYKKYRDHVLCENQVRKILHETGFETFDRPKNLPPNWKVEITQKKGGMKYKASSGDYVRVQPGNPNSVHACQQKPYVVHQTKKGRLDKYGNVVTKDSPESHIPLDEYDFTRIINRK